MPNNFKTKKETKTHVTPLPPARICGASTRKERTAQAYQGEMIKNAMD